MFLTNFEVNAETPQRDASRDFWFQPAALGAQTASGVHVTTDRAVRLSTVFKIGKVISETVAMLPIHFFKDKGEERDRISDFPLARKLNRQPNPWQTPFEFRQMVEVHRDWRGNGYARIYWADNGDVDMLVPLHPDRVKPELLADGSVRYKVKTLDGSREETLLPGEVMHIKGLTLDGYTGVNPIEYERETIGSAIAARDYGSRFWHNDARPPFWVEVPGKFENNEARTNFRSEWQAAYGGANRGRPATLDRGMKIHELGLKNSDAQWLDFRKYSEIDICGLWRMPPHKIGILDRATWGNIEQQNIEFVSDCILPQAISWAQCIWRDLVVDFDIYADLVVEQLLRGDIKTRYEAYGIAIEKGFMTPNEPRRKENMNPLPGLDRPRMPANMANVGEDGQPVLPSKKES